MNIFSKIFDSVSNWFFRPGVRKPTPADFRRKSKLVTRIIGTLSDPHARHIGQFGGGIVPMKRRFKGVSRTHGSTK